MDRRPAHRGRVAEVARVFGALGVRAVGGPAVHVALMRREVVERRGWVDAEEFGRLFAACSLVPGPASTQLAMLLGRRRAGWAGLAVAAALFIVPAVAIMLVLAELYVRGADGTTTRRVLLGAEAAVVGLVAAATVDLVRGAVRSPDLVAAAAVGLGLGVAHVTPLVALAAGGGLVVLARAAERDRAGRGRERGPSSRGDPRSALALPALSGPLHAPAAGTLVPLGLTFLKIGALSFGSGYVLLPFLHADLVGGRFGLTDTQIADAFAAGQATPGPVYATAAFLGDLVAGVPAGVLAAVAIFAPSFVLVALLDPIVRLVDRRRLARDAMAGVNAAAVGLIGSAVADLGHVAVTGVFEGVLAAAALLVVLRWPTAQPLALGLGLAGGGILAVT